MSKYCKKCDSEKEDSEFRLRVEKRYGKNFEYLNNTCRTCDSLLTREYHQKKKWDDDYMEKNRKRAKAYHSKNSKEIWKKNKGNVKRQQALKKWREENKDRVSELHKIRGSEWHIKNSSQITDSYCIARLLFKNNNPNFTREYILKNPELIEIKRTQILMYRLNKQIIKNEQK